MSEIVRILRQEIERQGVIPFTRFMKECLYHPELGYYERTGQVIGKSGDYFTSVSGGSLFGELLAFQAAEWLTDLPTRPVQLVEAGAHQGHLATDMLTWIGTHRPALLEELDYWIIEPSAERQAWQRSNLENFAGKVFWHPSFDSLPQAGINGLLFSNELLDAFPVRRLGWDARKGVWFEWGVALEKDRFAWAPIVGDQKEMADQLTNAGLELPSSLLAVLPDGFTLDLCPEAASWWQQASMALGCGRLLTVDYGLTAEQFLAPERSRGTLRAYHRHHPSADLLANPGRQDLTAHVNFTQLQKIGEAAGLRTDGLISQEQFLTTIAKRVLQNGSESRQWTPSQLRQFQTLTSPEHLGRSFRVLIQSRP